MLLFKCLLQPSECSRKGWTLLQKALAISSRFPFSVLAGEAQWRIVKKGGKKKQVGDERDTRFLLHLQL